MVVEIGFPVAKKGSSQGSIALIAIIIVVTAIAAITKEAWAGLLMLVVGYFILRAFTGQKKGAINDLIFGTRIEPVVQVPVQAVPHPDQAQSSNVGDNEPPPGVFRSHLSRMQSQTGKVADSEPIFSESDILAVKRRAETIQRAFSESLNIAEKSKNRLRRESRLRIAREELIELKKLANRFPFLRLGNVPEVEAHIIAVEAETSLLPYGELVDTRIKEASETGQPVSVFAPNCSAPTSYPIPSPLGNEAQNVRWVPADESVVIAGFTLPQGMIYFGSGLQAALGSPVVNPRRPVASNYVDEGLRLMGYWPSYTDTSSDARRAYLQWLAGGRCNPRTNIGYVFLFFYGLERRVLLDAKYDEKAHAEIPSILAEVKRLLEVYGESCGSFRSYADNFFEYVRLSTEGVTPVYQGDPPIEAGNYELPLRMRLGLGQMALNKIPVPPKWAHAWALAEPNIYRRTPVTRCPEAFESLFARKYTERFGEGMVLPVNKTLLKFGYRPASAGLLGGDFALSLGGVPDITATTVPTGRLQQLVDECTAELDGYSRFIGRNPDKKDSLEALLQLPPSLWPAPVRAELDDLKSRIGDGIVVMTFGELSGRLKSAGTLIRDKVLGFARALESMHLGMEPDVLAGAKTLKAEDSVVLFATHPEDGEVRVNLAYQAAAVTIGLSHAVAAADGDVSAPELMHLSRQTDSWVHLSAAHRKRLKAYLRLQMAQPTPLAAFKKKLEPLAQDARRAIALFLAHLAQADGVVSPEEVKLLEKLYKSLGVDSQLLYSDLHLATTPVCGESVTLSAKTDKGMEAETFSLDPNRIAALRKETEQVSSLLAGVFAEEDVAIVLAEEREGAMHEPGLVGLDLGHSAFLRLLLSRPSWSKQDLADAASDMELMLEGTLERINEAFFDRFDEALTEGEDPLEVNQSLWGKMPA
jgi:uncharacterized tellurite resistance protein B-like protein